jgi:hypothetical protein
MSDSQEIKLETALRSAADHPAERPEFYKVLLESSLYILGTSDTEAANGMTSLNAGEHISIRKWEKPDGTPVIPVFSSLAALQKAIKHESDYMKFPAQYLFEMTRGDGFVLNPESAYGKEFSPEEIEMLLTEGSNRLPEIRVIKAETRVYIGEPAIVPERMIAELSVWFSKCPNVRCAFLVLMHDPSIDEKPHFLVALDMTGNVEEVMRGAGVVAGDSSPEGEPVDLICLGQNNGGLEGHITGKFKPFYVRSWKQKLLAMFSHQRLR